jgi:hypothetical protein
MWEGRKKGFLRMLISNVSDKQVPRNNISTRCNLIWFVMSFAFESRNFFGSFTFRIFWLHKLLFIFYWKFFLLALHKNLIGFQFLFLRRRKIAFSTKESKLKSSFRRKKKLSIQSKNWVNEILNSTMQFIKIIFMFLFFSLNAF